MKTKTTIMRWLLILVLAVSATAAMANTGDQVVCVSNQPYGIIESTIPGAIYHWSVTGGTDPVNFHINGSGKDITIDWNLPGVYTLHVYTSANSCDGPEQSIIVTVVAQPTNPTLAAQTPTDATVCNGTDVSATFTAGAGGVGCSDVFEYRYDGVGPWTVYTAGANISTTGKTLVEIRGQRSGCTAGSGCTGTTPVILASWVVTSTLTVTVDITASADPVCAGTFVTYTATVGNGGTPTYEWHVNGGGIVGTSSTYNYQPSASDVITCIVRSNAPCASTAPVTGTFNPVVNPLPTTSAISHN